MKRNGKHNEARERPGQTRPSCNDILVSIILSESTSSLLNLDVPNIEECADVQHSTCIIRPVTLNQLQQEQISLFSYLFGRGRDIQGENNDISSEIAFFSDHFKQESDSYINLTAETDDDDDEEWTAETYTEEDEPIQAMPMNLYQTQVYVKPLLNAKTVAHENNISIEDNEIMVNLIDEDDDSSVSSELMCRICHGGESGGDLLKPCRCRGTIALAHVECLEHWLRESANSYCELCKHHFRIVRQPKYTAFPLNTTKKYILLDFASIWYGVLWSIFIYLSAPGEDLRDIVLDLVAFICYTPSAIATTYMLMVICENMAKAHLNRTRNLSAHLVAFCAIFGMAAIDFTYSSWLILTFQRHALAWRSWYRNNSYLKLILPEHKKKAYKACIPPANLSIIEDNDSNVDDV